MALLKLKKKSTLMKEADRLHLIENVHLAYL